MFWQLFFLFNQISDPLKYVPDVSYTNNWDGFSSIREKTVHQPNQTIKPNG